MKFSSFVYALSACSTLSKPVSSIMDEARIPPIASRFATQVHPAIYPSKGSEILIQEVSDKHVLQVIEPREKEVEYSGFLKSLGGIQYLASSLFLLQPAQLIELQSKMASAQHPVGKFDRLSTAFIVIAAPILHDV